MTTPRMSAIASLLGRGGVATLLALSALVPLAVSPARAQTQPPAPNAYVVQPESDQPLEETGSGYFRLDLRPGQARQIRVAVKNTGTEPVVLRSYAVDGVQVGGGVDYTTLGKPLAGLGSWLSLAPARLTLQPNEAQRIVVTLRVPASVRPGEHVGGIAIENERVESQGAGGSLLVDVRYR